MLMKNNSSPNRKQSLIPIVSIHESVIGILIKAAKEQEDDFVAFLVGNIEYNTPLGNPLISIDRVDRGIPTDDDIVPSPHQPNEVAIRYEFSTEEPSPPDLDSSKMEQIEQSIFASDSFDSNSFYQIVCYSWFRESLILQFYFPFPIAKMSFNKIGEIQKPMISKANYPTSKYQEKNDHVEAVFFGVENEQDPRTFILACTLSRTFNKPLRATIGKTVFELEFETQNEWKVYHTSVFSNGSSIFASFGNIRTDVYDQSDEIRSTLTQFHHQIEDINAKLNNMSSEFQSFKEEMKELITKEMKSIFANQITMTPIQQTRLDSSIMSSNIKSIEPIMDKNDFFHRKGSVSKKNTVESSKIETPNNKNGQGISTPSNSWDSAEINVMKKTKNPENTTETPIIESKNPIKPEIGKTVKPTIETDTSKKTPIMQPKYDIYSFETPTEPTLNKEENSFPKRTKISATPNPESYNRSSVGRSSISAVTEQSVYIPEPSFESKKFLDMIGIGSKK